MDADLIQTAPEAPKTEADRAKAARLAERRRGLEADKALSLLHPAPAPKVRPRW